MTVALDATADDQLTIDGPERVEVPANSRQAVLLTARTDENGIHEVTLVVTDKRGTPLGATTGLTIRSAQVSNVIWLFLGIGMRPALRRDRASGCSAGSATPAVRRPSPTTPGDDAPGRASRGARRSRHPVTDQPPATARPSTRRTSSPALLSNSAVMAAGTTVSRLSGFVRAALLSYALGASVHADIFNVANSLPNMLYILLAGGIFNAVLVPQLVRSLRNDPDRGDAYTNRVVTVAGTVPARVTVAAGRRRAAARRPGRSVDGDPGERSATPRSRSPASACRRSSSTGCSCWSARSSTPAARSAR